MSGTRTRRPFLLSFFNRAWHDRDSRGSVYVFSKAASGNWLEVQKLAPPSSRQSESQYFHGNYGEAVAMSDDATLLAVRSPYDYSDGLRGVVYMYIRGSDGKYTETERLSTPEGPQLSFASGKSLALLDDFLLIGSGSNKKVYVFKRTDSGAYRNTTELIASDASPDSIFGISLDGGGGDVLVHDCRDDASYLFSFQYGVWKERAKFDGCNTALSGNSIVTQSNQDFGFVDSGYYGGPVSFYDLDCE